jgi:hypothetical protein
MRRLSRRLSRRVGIGVGEGKSQAWDGVWEWSVSGVRRKTNKDLGIGRDRKSRP